MVIRLKNFIIYLTFDVDQDFSLAEQDYYNRDQAIFSGFTEGLPKIIKILNGVPFSVFLRADYQIKKIYGAYDYLITNYRDIIRDIRKNYGEINWHIHIYKEENNSWIQILDENEILSRFNEDIDYVRKIKELNSHIVRIGECVMNNKLMKALNEQNICIDSTALPGRKRNDQEKFFDWEITDNTFYHPSKGDYRIRDNNNYSLLEAPMTTIEMKADYDKQPFRRYINLSFKTEILFQNLENYIQDNDWLMTITHPFEILNKGSHGLISYDINVFEKNLKLLIEVIEKAGKVPVFKKVGDIL